MADDTTGVDPHAEGELSVEEFFERGNARDRGDEVDAPAAKTPESAAAPAEPADKTKPRSSVSSARRKSIQADIDDLTTTKHQTRKEIETATAELARLRQELRDLPRPPAASDPGNGQSAAPPAAAPPQERAFVPPPPHDPEPRLDQFAGSPDPYSAWSRETARWEARQEHRRLQSAQHADGLYRTRTTQLRDKLLQYETTHPGFSTALHPDLANLKFSTPREFGTPLGDLIVDSPHTAALLDHFSTHHHDFQRLSTLHPILAARELGKIESRFDAALPTGPALKPPPISNAKPPNKPVGHSPVISDDAEDEGELPVEEFFKRGNARDARRTSGRR